MTDTTKLLDEAIAYNDNDIEECVFALENSNFLDRESVDGCKKSLEILQTIKAALRFAKAMQPRPIEEAPRDGSYIILHRPKTDGRKSSAVQEGKFFKFGRLDTWRVRSGNTWRIDEPTHFTPLPDQALKEFEEELK